MQTQASEPVKVSNSILFRSMMTEAEERALAKHNCIFTKPAVRLIVPNPDAYGFYVEYDDGTPRVYSYAKGDWAWDIYQIARGKA